MHNESPVATPRRDLSAALLLRQIRPSSRKRVNEVHRVSMYRVALARIVLRRQPPELLAHIPMPVAASKPNNVAKVTGRIVPAGSRDAAAAIRRRMSSSL